jgi:tRNA pseudouridine55 synthase
MQNGIFLIDKAKGLSSAAEIARLKRKLNLQKVGHAGTLDPMATGLLVCLLNSATRLASFAEKGAKIYSGSIRFGVTTDTNDIEGEILSESKELPALNDVKELTPSFTGIIDQTPPAISAVKIAGERAYKIARRGGKPDIQSRKVLVKSFEVIAMNEAEVSFRIECGPGTYIRSIARDMGEILGCGGSLSSLRREYSAPFSAESAKKIEDLTADDCLDWSFLFPDINKVCFNSQDSKKLVSGDLKNIRPRLGEIIREQTRVEQDTVIYYEEALNKPRGILRNIAGNWEIAVNLH